MTSRGGREGRAVSPVVGYVLTLSVTTLLVSGLVIAAGGFVEDQRERTSRSELRVVGQQVSADIAAADRLNRTEGATDVEITRSIPERVVGSQYTVAVRTDSSGPTVPYLELTTVRPEVTVEVAVANETAVAETSVSGGEIRTRYNSTSDTLEVTRA
jgi:FlaG/FlaF family flagellin (archaellin)